MSSPRRLPNTAPFLIALPVLLRWTAAAKALPANVILRQFKHVTRVSLKLVAHRRSHLLHIRLQEHASPGAKPVRDGLDQLLLHDAALMVAFLKVGIRKLDGNQVEFPGVCFQNST
eukprot:CAMPEP_0177764702 /NCGR_PEP_ID=MMETSP0491_2-20121128/7554_1 /TAXON_ID=63592 /ORGANISM="Tetraselmis chuii, Strain PLY429" /LENGTH=115 /DNA_ID=CAMNT_0019280911 /DNA_START=91 /DNA_END=441 /DNA_ORIENTATION=-